MSAWGWVGTIAGIWVAVSLPAGVLIGKALHRLDGMHRMPSNRRCRAVLTRADGQTVGCWGRCQLDRGHCCWQADPATDHARRVAPGQVVHWDPHWPSPRRTYLEDEAAL